MLTILRGALPLASLEMLGLFLGLLTLPHLMRVLGPSGFGLFAFGAAACALLAMLVDYGFNQLGPKLVARSGQQDDEQARVFWGIQAAKVQLALFALPALLLLTLALGLGKVYGEVLPALCVGALASLMFPQWFLQGSLRLRTLALTQSIARVLAAAGQMTLVQSKDDVLLAVVLQAGIGVAAGLLALADAGYRRAIRWHPTGLSDGWYWLRQGRGLFISTLAVSSYTTAVPLLLGALASPVALGLFGAADRIRGAVQALLATVGTAAFPHFSRLMRENRARGLETARNVMLAQVGLALFACLAIATGAAPAIHQLVGDTFGPAVPVAQLLGLCIVCTAISNTLGMQVMLPLDMDRPFVLILSSCAAFGLLATIVFSSIWQQLGAALAVLCTEALVATLMALVLWRHGVWRPLRT